MFDVITKNVLDVLPEMPEKCYVFKDKESVYSTGKALTDEDTGALKVALDHPYVDRFLKGTFLHPEFQEVSLKWSGAGIAYTTGVDRQGVCLKFEVARTEPLSGHEKIDLLDRCPALQNAQRLPDAVLNRLARLPQRDCPVFAFFLETLEKNLDALTLNRPGTHARLPL